MNNARRKDRSDAPKPGAKSTATGKYGSGGSGGRGSGGGRSQRGIDGGTTEFVDPRKQGTILGRESERTASGPAAGTDAGTSAGTDARAGEGRVATRAGSEAAASRAGSTAEAQAQPADAPAVRVEDVTSEPPPPPGPQAVPLEDLGKQKIKPPLRLLRPGQSTDSPSGAPSADLRTAVEMLCAGLYSLPALAGYGEHWYLSDAEKRELGEDGEKALKSLPSKQVKWVTDIVTKYGPVTGFVVANGILIARRVSQTQRLIDEYNRKQSGKQTPPGVQAADGDARSRSAPSSTGRAKDFFGDAQ